MSDLKDIPAVAQSVDPAIREPITRLIQGYRALAGFTKDPFARALLVRDAQAGGVSVGNGVTLPIGGTADEPDLTPPPNVTGLTASAGISYVFVEWDEPIYTEGRGHLQTNLYAAKREAGDPEPTFVDAVRVYSATGALTNAAIPSEPNTIWHIWAKWETVDNVESTSPAGGLNGVEVTTGQDVAHLLEVLTGQITASQLHNDLGSRIDLIDASSAVTGSVNQRIAAVQAQVNDLLDTPEYDNGTTYAEDDVVAYDGGLYRALGTTTGNLPTNPTYWQKIGDYASLSEAVAAHSISLADHDARITDTEDGLVAEASDRAVLAAQIRGAYTGTDPSALAAGLLYNERQARVSSEAAIVSSVSALSATVSSNYSTLSSAITTEATARSSGDTAEATSRQALSTKLTGLTDPSSATLATLTSGLLYDERTARSTADGTLTTSINSVSARLNSGGDIANAIVSVTSSASAANAAAAAAQGTADTALSAATSAASQVTTLQSSISGIGGNLLPNSSFEVDTSADGGAAGWGAYNNSAPAEATTLSLVAGRLGGLAQRVTWAGTNTTTKGVYTDTAFVEGGIQGGVRGGWQPGKTYVISWWAKASSGSAGFTMETRWNSLPAAITALANPALSQSAWQRYVFRITWGGTVEANGRLFVSMVGGSAATGYLDFDDMQVQEGEFPTGYAPGDAPVLTAALQQEVVTRASQTGALLAQWTVKTDLYGYVSGFGLASTANNATPISAFIVRADSFSISSPSGPGITPVTPFIVQTTPGTINGVAVPVGVYMDAAYILRGSITGAQIGNAVIDDAKIASLSAAKLTVGDGTVGGNLKSTIFSSGSAGWQIQPNGYAEFNDVTVRGTVHASAGTFAGALSAATGTFAGVLSAATGTFAGSLSAATGTFNGVYAGNVTASQVVGEALRGVNVNAASHTTKGTYLTSAASGGAGTLSVQNTADFASSGSGWIIDTTNDRDAFSWTGKTSTTLTGCSGVLAHNSGATVIPATAGMVIDAATNEMRYFGNRGDGTIAELAAIGINPVGSDAAIVRGGATVAGYSRIGVMGESGSGIGVWGRTLSGQSAVEGYSYGEGVGVLGWSNNTGNAIQGFALGSGTGVSGASTGTGWGGAFSGNATKAPLYLTPQMAQPSNLTTGQFCVVDEKLYFCAAGVWNRIAFVSDGGGG